MSLEKRSVLVALIISAAIVIALYCALWFYGAVMSGTVISAFVVVYIIIGVIVFHVVEELCYLKKEKRIIADYEASHRHSVAIPPTRIAAIDNRQRRNSARLC